MRINSLITLQLRQFKRNKSSKKSLYGFLIAAIYFWIIDFVIVFALKDEGVEIPAFVAVIILSCFLIPDFILKLIMVPDNTVMDAFLKTRPVPQDLWERFVSLSQFWKLENLEMPLIILPLCFLLLPFWAGLLSLFLLYLFSVLGGFIVMLIKHRGNYQSEKMTSSGKIGTVRSRQGRYIFGIQSRSFLRSKRLKGAYIYLAIILYLQYVMYAIDGGRHTLIYLVFFIFLITMTMSQYGLGIEANFFGGIWTKPVAVSRLLQDKYYFSICFGFGAALLCLPVVLWTGTSALRPFSIAIFTGGFLNLILLSTAYRCTPIDLFAKVFFNNRGNSTKNASGSTIAVTFLTMGMLIGIASIKNDLLCDSLCLGLGITGFLVHRPFFRFLEGRFLKNRYRYMRKFSSL